jgi:hypothetical protein
MAMVERDLDTLTLGFERALQSHLKDCHDCNLQAQQERLLVDDLASLRGVELPQLDLRASMLERIQSERPQRQDWVSQGQLGWAAITTCGIASLIAIGLWQQSGWLGGAAVTATRIGAVLVSIGVSLLSIGKQILVLPWRLFFGLVGDSGVRVQDVAVYEPLAAFAVVGALVLMTAVIGWIVGQDLMRPGSAPRDRS